MCDSFGHNLCIVIFKIDGKKAEQTEKNAQEINSIHRSFFCLFFLFFFGSVRDIDSFRLNA